MNKKEDRQVKMLEIVKSCIENNYCLDKTFKTIATKLNLKKESAKNYYYSFIKTIKNNPNNCNLELNKLNKNNFNKFELSEIDHLISTIDNNLLKGKSVRSSCLELANNDAKLMLRLQNKYRNFKKSKLNKEGKKDMKNNELEINEDLKQTKKQNIINIDFAKQKINKRISDNDINALFMGLVKIVKKNALDSANRELKVECNEANENFRQTLIDLNRKEAELKIMQEENRELNLKVEAQKEQICLLLQKLSNRRLKTLEKKSDNKTMKLKKFDLSK